jgi:hypothetical protein
VNGIEAFGLSGGDRLPLDGHDPKVSALDLRDNGSGETFADRVRLDDAEGALCHVNYSLKIVFDFIVKGQC